MTAITMPRLSDSMEQGTILTWLKREGQRVEAGDDLLEIETDKATMTYAAEASGILSILAPEGTSLPVGATMARLGEAGATQAPPGNGGLEPAEAAVAVATVDVATSPAAGDDHRRGTGDGADVKATPLARRVALVHGVSLADVVGTGRAGRITRGDVLTKAGVASAEPVPLAPTPPSAEPPTPPSAEPPTPPAGEPAGLTAKGEVQVVDLTRVQTVVARRMVEAKATAPEFQVQTEVAMDAAVAFRAQLKEADAAAPSFNDLIVKAAAVALRGHPRANGSFRDGRLELHSRVNVGIAVAADDDLVVPTIFDADQKSLGAIGSEARRLAERVRAGTVTPQELSGATFTVSNLGMYGATAITPVLNVPQAAILGVGAMRTVLARDGGDVVDRTLMTLTLTCDHRVLHGAGAAQFLSAIRALLEQPLRLAL
ncbi:MAG TPA: dihydrolipoamide acetyltransferase family protein [Solirubrobacteraceae bacterium]